MRGLLLACSCVVNAHLCGELCALSGKRGCLDDCTKVRHWDSARSNRLLTVLRWPVTSETSTGVRRLFICVAKYDLIHLC